MNKILVGISDNAPDKKHMLSDKAIIKKMLYKYQIDNNLFKYLVDKNAGDTRIQECKELLVEIIARLLIIEKSI
jgi:hypothetical protein